MFREALQHHETPVRADLWASIQSNIGNAGAASSAASGSSLIAKALAVMSIAGAVAATSISEVKYYNSNQAQVQDAGDVANEKTLAQEEEAAIAFDENQGDMSSQPNANVESSSFSSVQTNEIVLEDEPSYSSMSGEGLHQTQVERQIPETPASIQSIPSEIAIQPTKTAEPQRETEPASVAANHQPAVSAAAQGDNEPQKTTAYFTREIPNVFTPNGDGFNDYFFVEGSGFESFSISIMSRMGAVVYESNSIDFRWDGKDRFGNSIPDGVYFYEIRAYGMDGLPYLEENSKGTITVIRTKR